MKFKPLGARVMVRPVEREQTTESGIVLPDTAKEKPQSAEVVAVGTHEDVKVSVGDVSQVFGNRGRARRRGAPDRGRREHPRGDRGVASGHE